MVKYEDLCDSLSNVPLAIARLMSIRQFEQTGRIDPEVFQDDVTAGRNEGGFTWAYTPEGDYMWDQLLYYRRPYKLPLYFTNDIAIFPNTQLISECYDRTA